MSKMNSNFTERFEKYLVEKCERTKSKTFAVNTQKILKKH